MGRKLCCAWWRNLPSAGGSIRRAIGLVISLRGQEQLLGKAGRLPSLLSTCEVCSLLVSLDEKMGRIAAAQERMEVGRVEPGPAVAGRAAAPLQARGALVAPPGKSYAGGPLGGGGRGGFDSDSIFSCNRNNIKRNTMLR